MHLNSFKAEIASDGNVCAKTGSDIEIIGRPRHSDKKNLIEKYTDSPSDYIRYEEKYSCGDYFLVDTRSGLRIITSFGFRGGYIGELKDRICVYTTLGSALKDFDKNIISIRGDQLIHYFFTKQAKQMPFTTIFEGIFRLPPGVIFNADDEGFEQEFYLSSKRDVSFSDALDETMSSLDGEDVVLGLSGGVDSVCFACSLIKNDIPFRTVTFDFDLATGSSEGPVQAARIADKLGVDHEVVEVSRIADGELLGNIESSMREDLYTYQSAPSWGFLNLDLNDEIGIHGQNMDAMVSAKMKNPGYKLSPKLVTQPKALIDIFVNKIGYSIPVTEFGLSHHQFRRYYINTISNIYPRLNQIDSRITAGKFGDSYNMSHDNTLDSAFIGILSTDMTNIVWERPNHLNITKGKAEYAGMQTKKELFSNDFDSKTYLNDQMPMLKSISRHADFSPSQLLRLLLFFSYCNSHTKAPKNCLYSEQAVIEAPVMWAPLLNHFFSKRQSVTSTLSPKREVYEYVRDFSGESFHDMKTAGRREKQEFGPLESNLVDKYSHRFSKEYSKLLPLISEEKRRIIDSIYQDVHQMMLNNSIESKSELRFLQRMINLELVLDNLCS